MNIPVANLEGFIEIVPKLSRQKVLYIVNSNRNLPECEIVDILLREESLETVSQVNNSKLNDGVEPFIDQCMNPNCNRSDQCKFYHNEKQRRRPQGEFNYCNKPCEIVFRNNYWEFPGVCKRKENCKFAHTENEIRYYRHMNAPSSPWGISSRVSEGQRNAPVERVKAELEPVDHNGVLLKNEIVKKHKEIKELNETILGKKIQIERLDSGITRNLQKLNCVACNNQQYAYLNIPCSHPICPNCRLLPYCIKCHKTVKSILELKIIK